MSTTYYERLEKTLIPCPACAGTEFEELCTTDRYLMGLRTVRCRGCRLVMTNPMPTEAALQEFYTTHYRRYYRKLDRPDLSYIRRYAMDRRAEGTVEHLVDVGLLGPGARVLDFGCGEGSIPRAIVERCSDVITEGVEIYEPFAAFAETYSTCTIHRYLEELETAVAEGEDGYDLILLSHVLEHLLDPVTMLRRLTKLLRTGGRIFLDVPDLCEYHWLADLHIAHVYHFSLATLVGVCHAAGLEVDRYEFHRPPKLPGCVRVLASPEAEGVDLPSVTEREDQAAVRLRKMGRFALPFSIVFRLTMSLYEWSWNLRSRGIPAEAPPPRKSPVRPASSTSDKESPQPTAAHRS